MRSIGINALCLTAVAATAVLSAWMLFGTPFPEPEPLLTDSTVVSGTDESVAGRYVNYRPLGSLFAAVSPGDSVPSGKTDPSPGDEVNETSPVAPERRLRYLGSVMDGDRRNLYYLKDETNGKLVKVGMGVSCDGVEFIKNDKERITLRVGGVVTNVEK